MKKVFCLILALVSIQSYAATCVFAPNSSASPACELPPLTANQCVSYDFQWQYQGGTPSLSLSLGASQVIAPTQLTAAASDHAQVYQAKGKVCNVTAAQQFPLTDPVILDQQIIVAPGLGVQTSEDTSYGSTLTFSITGQRGFGPVTFLGGTVDVH